jgi:DNA-binding GntR family transcriptional regulator
MPVPASRMALMSALDRREDAPALRRQVANHVRGLVTSGELRAGDVLPGTEALAREYGVHKDTIHAAMRQLAQEGLVVRIPRVGTVVAGDDPQHVEVVRGPARITVRQLTQPERAELDLPVGVALLVVDREVDGEPVTEQHLSHTTILEIP